VPVLWGRRMIRELEEGEGMDLRRGSSLPRRVRERTEAELVRLGTRYGLMSSATSYVAIEERSENERVEDRAELREIPVALTKGWGGMIGGPGFAGAMPASMSLGDLDMCSAPPPSAKRRVRNLLRRKSSGQPSARVDHRLASHEAVFEEHACASIGEVMPPRDPDAIPGFFYDQRADGSWRLTPDLAGFFGADIDDLRELAKGIRHPEAESVLATFIVLVHAQVLSPRAQKLLTPTLRKARLWLDKATTDLEAPDGNWYRWARSAVADLK